MVLLASSAAAGAAALGPAGAVVGAALSTLAPVPEAMKWSVPLGLQKRALPDQDAQMQTLLRCVNVLIGLVQQRASKVLLILDGLDRIESFERAKALLLDSRMLGQLDCRIVVCGPFVLRRDGAIANVRGFSDAALLMSPFFPRRTHSNTARVSRFLRTYSIVACRKTTKRPRPNLCWTVWHIIRVVERANSLFSFVVWRNLPGTPMSIRPRTNLSGRCWTNGDCAGKSGCIAGISSSWKPSSKIRSIACPKMTPRTNCSPTERSCPILMDPNGITPTRCSR